MRLKASKVVTTLAMMRFLWYYNSNVLNILQEYFTSILQAPVVSFAGLAKLSLYGIE